MFWWVAVALEAFRRQAPPAFSYLGGSCFEQLLLYIQIVRQNHAGEGCKAGEQHSTVLRGARQLRLAVWSLHIWCADVWSKCRMGVDVRRCLDQCTVWCCCAHTLVGLMLSAVPCMEPPNLSSRLPRAWSLLSICSSSSNVKLGLCTWAAAGQHSNRRVGVSQAGPSAVRGAHTK